ncbi:MAG: glycosyltransferase family 1 protein, partial [Chlamydiia bacterium]|nr:glycosyltransferase family 1 protein [Chlamydiia bacterium]
FGTCIDYESVAACWGEEERETLIEASSRVLSKESPSIYQALLDLEVPPVLLPRMHGEVDRYTRGKDRVALIQSLKGHRIHIWGEGPWEKYVPHAIIGPTLTFEGVIEIMKQSRIVLNSAPRFKAGTHERIFYALMCGASVYTGASSYLKRYFPTMHTYHYGEWSGLQVGDWAECAEEGQSEVLRAHTWDARAETLILTEIKEKSCVN